MSYASPREPALNGGFNPLLLIAGEEMQLMRIGTAGMEKPVVRINDTHYIDVSDEISDYDGPFFAGDGMDRLRSLVAQRTGRLTSFEGERIGAPIARPHQIVCLGLNYTDLAAEIGQEIPEEPTFYIKAPNTMVGPNDDVRLPRGSTKAEWEVELGVVIGKRTSYLGSLAKAREAIAGYVLVNDISERAFQTERGGHWTKGKSSETFNPTGPWLATPDEVMDVLQLTMQLEVNGVRQQAGSTSAMAFDPYFTVHYLSQFMVLEPGDLINTGTPQGIGMSSNPQVWLQPGDVVDLCIDKLGTQRQTVIASR
jgi:2,4-diketo-3-deoxy-L-fuconate hydrolase